MTSTVQTNAGERRPAQSGTTPITSRRPPGLWEDVEIDRELRRASQLIRQCDFQTDGGRDGAESLGAPYLPASLADPRNAPENLAGTNSQPWSPPQPGVALLTATNRPGPGASVPLLAGAVLLTVGIAFLAIAVVDQRPDWWQPGLPLAILGQASLSLGILLKLR